MNSISQQAAILIAAVMISVSILIHGGIIKIGKTTPAAPAAAQPAGEANQAKTDAQRAVAFKETAKQLRLNQAQFDKCLDDGGKGALISTDYDEGVKFGVGGTPSFFVNGRPLFIGAAPFSEFKKIIDEEINQAAPASAERKEVGVGDLPPLGSLSAPVTLIEFSDYECPFCSRFYNDAEAQIKKEYIDSGKVKLYYRDFPLKQIHLGAQKAAEAARCAGDQGKYWEYHNLLFENQSNIF